MDEQAEKVIPILFIARGGKGIKAMINLKDNPISNPSNRTTALEDILVDLMHRHDDFAEIMISATVRFNEHISKMQFKTELKN